MEREGNRIVESAGKARAGETGHNVRYVLAAGSSASPCCSWRFIFTTSPEGGP